MDWPFEALAPFSFDVAIVDFPWEYKLYSEAGNLKSASAQYDTMPLEEILTYPIGHLGKENSVYLIWICEWMRPGDLQIVLDVNGLTYKSSMVWRKTTKNGKVRMGPGYRVRTMHERIMVATTGNPKHKPFPSVFDGVARQHSRKPEEFYDLVRRHTPGAIRADIFSRQTREGFVSWGKQSTLFDAGDPASMKREILLPEPGKLEPMPLFELA
jgi:N6-adenosine-specific RNA methylase IME4